jgi:hypothetical protein
MRCDIDCTLADSAALNRGCGCAVVDIGQLRDRLEAQLPAPATVDPVMHAHLFSPHALFVDRSALDAMAAVAAAVFAVGAQPRYVEQVLRWAPAIARHDPGSIGGVLGLDFHLTVEGPRLIEVNTNPGGLLLNALLADAARSCAPAWMPWSSGAAAADAGVAVWLDEARQQLGHLPKRLAIVDVMPGGQFLYPEFELYARAFRAHGVEAVIRAPEALLPDGEGLRDADGPVDAVYNRLTDFALADPACAALAAAYLAGTVALTPHPRAHAIYADKRNLAVLGDARQLLQWQVDAATAALLSQAIPTTVELTADNRDALWTARGGYFFKPATGFGSRGSYRGDKLTRRTWEAMLSAQYVAQAFAPPGARILHHGVALKADVRCYASAAGALLFAARLYQGQTTNMRTPQGGFAAVLTG